MAHPLHKIVGQEFKNYFNNKSNIQLFCDPTCGGNQNLPFFIGEGKSNDKEITNVDLIVIKDDKIKLACEIDESNTKPVHIFGKFLSLVSTDACMLKKGKSFEFDQDIIFIQVLSKEKLKPKSKKPQQWTKIEESIKTNFQSFRHFKSIKYAILASDNRSFQIIGLTKVLQDNQL